MINHEKIYYSPIEKLVFKVLSIASIMGIFAVGYCLLDGVASFYGKTIRPLIAIDMILDVFTMGKNFYRGIAGLILGIFYISSIVIIVKNAIESAIALTRILFHPSLNGKRLEDSTETILIRFNDSIAQSLLFACLTSWTIGNIWNTNFDTLIKCLGVVIILRVLFALIKMPSISVGFQQLMYQAILIGGAILFIYRYTETFILDGISAIQTLRFVAKASVEFEVKISVKQMLALFYQIANPALYIAISVICLKLVRSDYVEVMEPKNGHLFLQNFSSKLLSKQLITLGLICTIGGMVCALIGKTPVTLEEVKNAFSPHYPRDMLILGLFTIQYYPPIPIKINLKNSIAIPVPDDRGVLTIDGDYTSIPPYAYADQTHITIVYIKKSVVYVGQNVFYGCGGITAIYCESDCKPKEWSNEWSNGCYATIHWGYQPKEVEDT